MDFGSDPQEQAINRPSPVNGQVPPVNGRFRPGKSGNPNGRPKGRSLTAILRAALERESNDEPGKTVAEVLVDALLNLANIGRPGRDPGRVQPGGR